MRRFRVAVAILAAGLLHVQSAAVAQSPQTCTMAQGGEITFPRGDLPFADRVVRFEEGSPRTSDDSFRDPTTALAPPNYIPYDGTTAFTLGCRGSVVLEFVDSALVDVAGLDLHVWEVGPDIEPTNLAISKDGMEWLAVGKTSGSTAGVDITDHVEPGESHRFVRLTDLECQGSSYPGADIDAVAAVGTAERFVFDSAVLFAFDEASLTAEAQQVLAVFAEDVADRSLAELRIGGHTDSVGTASYNADLSLQRADAIPTSS